MNQSIPINHYGKEEVSHTWLAVKIKKMLNDIIDNAYKDIVPSNMLGKFKQFTIFCTEAQMKSRLADCRVNKDGSSSIRLLGVSSMRYQNVLITAIHEVSHHIDYSLHGVTGHGNKFYQIHKILLYAAFDMGILLLKDVVEEDTGGRDKFKLAKMMSDYVPQKVDYKNNIVQFFVYNCYAVKNHLKEHGYHWNKLESAWTKEVVKDAVNKEKDFLLNLHLTDADIRIVESNAVIARIRKNVRIFNVPWEHKDIVKELGYRWVNEGKLKYWQKRIESDDISVEERIKLEKINEISIVII